MRDKIHVITAAGMFVLLLATFLIYQGGLDGPFLLDDYANIEAAYVSDFDLDRIYYEITHNRSGTLGRPISILSLLFSGIVHGPEAWGYKFHNLIIHMINGLLIFWLLVKLLPRLAPAQSQQNNLAIAGLVSALWLLHPLLVSTVLYAVQRMAQLSALFTLLSLVVYLNAREAASQPGWRFYVLAYLALPGCVLLSLFSKENGILIPLYIMAIELAAFRLDYSFAPLKSNRLVWFLGLFIVFPIVAGASIVLLNLDAFTNYQARDFTLGERLMTQLHVVMLYLKMILLPRLSDMTLFHDYLDVTRSFDAVTGMLLLVLLSALFLVVYLYKRAPVLSFAIAWFLISHSLESTVFSLELMFEHRNYLAAVGPLLAVVHYLFNIPAMPKLKYLTGFFLVLVVFLTTIRVQEWSNEETIYAVAVAEHPDSARAQSQLGNLKYNRGDIPGALEHLQRAQKNNTRDVGPVLHELAVRCTSGVNMKPLLDEAMRRASLYPATAYSLNSIDNILIYLNENRCPEVTLDDLLAVVEAAENQPDNIITGTPVGVLEKVKGQIYMLKGDIPKSIEYAFSAYEKTGMTTVLSGLTRNLIQLGMYDDAEAVIGILEGFDAESGGREAGMINPLKAELADARMQQQAFATQAEAQQEP